MRIDRIIFLLSSTCLLAQSPGGVGEVSLWLKSDAAKTSSLLYKDYSGNDHAIAVGEEKNKPQYSVLNYNEAMDFDGNNSFLTIPYVMETLNKANLFIIYQNKNTQRESALLTTDFSGEKELYYSTANIFRYNNEQINFIDPQRMDSTASLAMYSQFDRPAQKIGYVMGNSGNSHLYIGKDTGSRNWASFRGKLPELLIYRKILTQNERDRVNSYLVIKYGITIPMTEYLSSKSRKIWKKEDYQEYPQHVAGIAIDRHSGLYQKQSTSTSEAQRLVIAAKELAVDNKTNTAELPDQTFLVWGNTTDPLSLDEETFEQQLLKRKWKIRLTAEQNQSFPSEVVFHTKDLIPELPEGKKIWLLLNRSGKGDFNTTDLEAYPMDFIDDQGSVHFKNMVFDKDFSGTDTFTFGLGSGLWVANELTTIDCKNGTSALKLNLFGGVAPYTLSLKKEGGAVQHFTATTGQVNVGTLHPGVYTLEIVDRNQASSRLSFTINDFSSIDRGLSGSYTLPANGYIELDASKNVDARGTLYQWNSSNGFTSTQAKVKLYEPGEYTVTATTSDGCVNTSTISVTQTVENGIAIFPNPTHAGDPFTILIRQSKAEDVAIRIFDMSGRMVKERKESGQSFYEIKETLPVAGSYVVMVETPTQKKTFKLIIN